MSGFIKAAVFDLDGTLIASNSVWERIDTLFAEECGVTLTSQEAKLAAAMPYEEVCKFYHDKGINATYDEIVNRINELAEYEYANNIPLKKGAKELLLSAKEYGVKIALCTGSPAQLYVPVLKKHEIYELFDIFASTDEVGNRDKDKPDVFLLAAERLGASAAECMVFEDSLTALRTAALVGMRTVGVADEYNTHDAADIEAAAEVFLPELNISFGEIIGLTDKQSK